jgi:hypothetical protein
MLREQEKSVESIRTDASFAAKRLEELVTWSKSSNAGMLWSLGDIPGQAYSYSEALLEAERVASAVVSIPASRMGLASNAATSALLTAIKGLRQSVVQLNSALVSISKAPGGAAISNEYTATQKDGTHIADVGQLAAACVNSGEAVKAALPQFIVYPRHEPKIGKTEVAQNALLRQTIDAGTQKVAEALATVEQMLSQARAAEESTAGSASAASTLNDQVSISTSGALEAAQEAQAAIEQIRSQAEEVKKAIDASVGEIDGLRNEAVEIKTDAESFRSNLEESRSKLDEIVMRADKKFADQTDYVKRVEELVAKATNMLSQATVAGLAKAFDDERKDLDRRMRGAMIGFSVGIGLIFLVTGMLAAYVFRIESGQGFLGVPSNEVTVTISGFLARSVILLGPVWLALFSARRYRNLFDLRQQYSHKYNMAFSVNGFQTQAPEYSEQIAYWVFQTIGANPVSSAAGGGSMDEHPVEGIKDLLKAVVDRLPFPQKTDG